MLAPLVHVGSVYVEYYDPSTSTSPSVAGLTLAMRDTSSFLVSYAVRNGGTFAAVRCPVVVDMRDASVMNTSYAGGVGGMGYVQDSGMTLDMRGNALITTGAAALSGGCFNHVNTIPLNETEANGLVVNLAGNASVHNCNTVAGQGGAFNVQYAPAR